MDEPRQPDPSSTDPVGEGAAWQPSLGPLAIALGLVIGMLAYWWTLAPSPVAEAPAALPVPVAASRPIAAPPPRVAAAASVPAVAAADPAPRIPRLRGPNSDQSPDLADYVNDGEKPTMAEVIDRLHQAGVHTGLGAFSPPGTRPPLIGLAVPEGFVLPDGYVRHYQATDDGQRIEPILMYAPDHVFQDANHQPIAIPPDRVVPPEHAPPGLPIRRIVVPAPADASRPGS